MSERPIITAPIATAARLGVTGAIAVAQHCGGPSQCESSARDDVVTRKVIRKIKGLKSRARLLGVRKKSVIALVALPTPPEFRSDCVGATSASDQGDGDHKSQDGVPHPVSPFAESSKVPRR